GQMGYNTVRIVIDLKRNVAFQVRSPVQTSEVQVALAGGGGRPYAGGAPPSLTPMPVSPPPGIVQRPTPTLPDVPPGEGVHITGVSYKTVGALTQILVAATGEAKYTTELLDNPRRLAFDLAGATLDTPQRQLAADGNPVMKQVRWGIFRSGDSQFGRVVVDLQRPVPFTVTRQPADGGGTVYAINLQMPPVLQPYPVAGGLAGKVVVVDPGHGYQDSGAVGFGVREKDLTLAIGLKLRDTLRQNGATVFMTRDDDGFLPVMARPQVAIAHNADLFVSIHCDDAGPANSHSGTTVYYHAHNPICRRMAADISARVADVSGIPQDGIKSDTIRFATGFGVLRGSPMPAVLVECGYVNDLSDVRKLQDADTQQRIAEGIVAGLRDFLGGRTASR
ncbi:MAG: N-acetylmuramoyl-L-alanine amidase, partial [Armatimonadetes bacterium]|nr:N-acetylmuramoyl-L-alanine amidase [Armatimonadota bacterium]